MSYRLISLAAFSVVSASGLALSRVVSVRAYPSPKRDPAGLIEVDGVSVAYKRTGGKGRGTIDQRYAYATVKGTSGFWPITESEASALVGGTATLACVAADAPAPVAEPVAEPAPVAEPTPVAEPVAPIPALTRKQRRSAKAEA